MCYGASLSGLRGINHEDCHVFELSWATLQVLEQPKLQGKTMTIKKANRQQVKYVRNKPLISLSHFRTPSNTQSVLELKSGEYFRT